MSPMYIHYIVIISLGRVEKSVSLHLNKKKFFTHGYFTPNFVEFGPVIWEKIKMLEVHNDDKAFS